MKNRSEDWPEGIVRRCNLELDRFSLLISHLRDTPDGRSFTWYTVDDDDCTVDIVKVVSNDQSTQTSYQKDLPRSDRSTQTDPLVLHTVVKD